MFVGNLNYQTTKDELVAFLSPAGEIVDAFLPTDRETGRPRGFAFITFATEEQAADCVTKFNGQSLGGRSLNINPADDRRRGGGGGPGPRGPRPGGGGGGGPRRGPGGPPRRDFEPPPMPEDDPLQGEWRDVRDSWEGGSGGDDDEHWKKKKKRKGSRRGLRAKKRSL